MQHEPATVRVNQRMGGGECRKMPGHGKPTGYQPSLLKSERHDGYELVVLAIATFVC